VSATVVDVDVTPPYRVHVGPGTLARLAEEAAPFSRCAVMADERVAALHADRLGPLVDAPRHTWAPGEETKTLAQAERALDFLAGAGLDRRSLVVALGGGVTSDLGGLVASLYMRGIAVIHCPTTLLAQVDAAVGGKTGVNLHAGKNLAGTFHQPHAVLCDSEVLGTLDDAELRCGLGEVVKAAVLGAPALLELLEQRGERLVTRDPATLAAAVTACVRHKAGVVAADEREGGLRRSLNLGHTFAHAIEHAAGYGTVPHGVAVGVGVALALEASRELGLLEQPDLPGRVLALLEGLGLPASLDGLRRSSGRPLAADELVAAMRLDKKAAGGELALVLPRRAGQVELDVRPPEGLLERLLAPR
jgi:3-dehydroquinate synthase